MYLTKRAGTILVAATRLALLPAVLAGCVPDSLVPAKPAKVTHKAVYVSTEMMGCLIEASRLTYIPDELGKDTWQTPAETQARQAGDCEDIAIYLQDRLQTRGVASEVVFGLQSSLAEHGHCWLEYQKQGEVYIVESRSCVIYRRSKLPEFMYIRADDIDVVHKKIQAYHARTGVWVNQTQRGPISPPD
jgi:hypothetical protein